MDESKLTEGEQFVIYWQFGKLGHFRRALAEAFVRADEENTAKLALGFPEIAEAMSNFAHVSGWWRALLDKAGIED